MNYVVNFEIIVLRNAVRSDLIFEEEHQTRCQGEKEKRQEAQRAKG